METIKNIIKSLGIISTILSIIDFIRNRKNFFHIHKWEVTLEDIDIVGSLQPNHKVTFTSRFCPYCGKKQIKFGKGWRDWKMTKEEMRDFKLNQIL